MEQRPLLSGCCYFRLNRCHDIPVGIKPVHSPPCKSPERAPDAAARLLSCISIDKADQEFEPVEHQNPSDIWQERAQKFINWAHENLKLNNEVMAWLATRGISAAAVDKYRLGWNPGEDGKDIYRPRQTWGLAAEIKQETGKPKKLWIPIGLVIPLYTDTVPLNEDYKHQIVRIRIRRPEQERQPRRGPIRRAGVPVEGIGVKPPRHFLDAEVLHQQVDRPQQRH